MVHTKSGAGAQAGGTFLEFFAGAGMAQLAFNGRLECSFANDIDEMKADQYVRHFGPDALVIGDVADLSVKDLPAGRADLGWASLAQAAGGR